MINSTLRKLISDILVGLVWSFMISLLLLSSGVVRQGVEFIYANF